MDITEEKFEGTYNSGVINSETIKQLYIQAITYIGKRYRIDTDLNYKQGNVKEVKYLLDIMIKECYDV